MTPKIMVGIALIALGAAGLVVQTIRYTSREKVVDVAGIQISADTRKTVSVPLIVGGAALAAGVAFVVVGSKRLQFGGRIDVVLEKKRFVSWDWVKG